MDRKKKRYLPYIIIAGLGLVIAWLLLSVLPYRYRLNVTVRFTEFAKPVKNPLIGYAPPAENETACADSNLVYIGLTWADWEPQEGVYAIDMLEETYHIAKWKQENKHAVLRFVCDIPGSEMHKDIPEWLYQKTGDGTDYDTSYGKGYSPNYANAFFRQRHQAAVEALAAYCNEDDFVAYVELGSLGHWGEWHTNTAEGVQRLPEPEICWEYTLAYSNHFHNARLLMRRNYVMAAEGRHGLYHDMIGDTVQTERWENWIRNGGSYETEGGALPYVPMEEFWKYAPAGGEFTSSHSMSELLGDRFSETLDIVERLHGSFIGPKIPEGEWADSAQSEAIEALLGYRLYISELTTRYSYAKDRILVDLTWENAGQAPMYWDWPVTLYVYDRDGNLEYWETVDIKLSEVFPGHSVTTRSTIPFTDLFRQGFRIGIGITNPEKNEFITLAMDCETVDNRQIIYSYE
jgi:hypothetical protein